MVFETGQSSQWSLKELQTFFYCLYHAFHVHHRTHNYKIQNDDEVRKALWCHRTKLTAQISCEKNQELISKLINKLISKLVFNKLENYTYAKELFLHTSFVICLLKVLSL